MITRTEEKACGKKSGMYFEVEGQPYATHPWGDSQMVTQKMRQLAVIFLRRPAWLLRPVPVKDVL